MKKLLFLFLLIFSSQSFAEWKGVAKSDLGDFHYIDSERITEKKNGNILYWQLTNFNKPEESEYGIYQSAVTYNDAGCELFRVKKIYFIFYKNRSAVGKPIHSVENPEEVWKYASPNSIIEFFLNRVCK